MVLGLRDIFTKFDKAVDGSLSYDEFIQGLEEFKKIPNVNFPSDISPKELFNAIDIDNSGRIDYTEFIASCIGNPLMEN